MIIKNLGDLRKAIESLNKLPDSVEVAIDDGEEFRDFELEYDGEQSIAFRAV